MQRSPVVSKQIFAIGYDYQKHVLEIEFQRNHAVYQYANVPEETYALLCVADSFGRFFNANIKGKFDFIKLAPEEVHASSEAQAATATPEDSQAQAATARPDDGSSSR